MVDVDQKIWDACEFLSKNTLKRLTFPVIADSGMYIVSVHRPGDSEYQMGYRAGWDVCAAEIRGLLDDADL